LVLSIANEKSFAIAELLIMVSRKMQFIKGLGFLHFFGKIKVLSK